MYDLQLAWWKLTYTASSKVTAISPPESLEWRLVEDVDARGEWRVEPEPEAAPADAETASRIFFEALYDPTRPTRVRFRCHGSSRSTESSIGFDRGW